MSIGCAVCIGGTLLRPFRFSFHVYSSGDKQKRENHNNSRSNLACIKILKKYTLYYYHASIYQLLYTQGTTSIKRLISDYKLVEFLARTYCMWNYEYQHTSHLKIITQLFLRITYKYRHINFVCMQRKGHKP
ncbi:MAG TPA: hypothetical protein VIY08_04385 [Candidatus Nitrosocosmicus sp.]